MHIRITGRIALLFAILASTANGAGDGFKMFGPPAGPTYFTFDYALAHRPAADVERQGEEITMTTHAFSAGFAHPVGQNGEIMLGASYGLDIHDTGALLPDSNVELPNQWHEPGLTLGYRSFISPGRLWGAEVTVSSPSDDPFGSGDETAVMANLVYTHPVDASSSWLFALNYSNTRIFLNHVPLPGVLYRYAWGEPGTFLMAGIPMIMVNVRNPRGLGGGATYLYPDTVKALLSYNLHPAIGFYTSFEADNRSWFRASREDADDRIFYYEKRVKLGVRSGFSRDFRVDVSGGWAWDRFIFEGEDWDDRADNRIGIDDGWTFEAQLSTRF